MPNSPQLGVLIFRLPSFRVLQSMCKASWIERCKVRGCEALKDSCLNQKCYRWMHVEIWGMYIRSINPRQIREEVDDYSKWRHVGKSVMMMVISLQSYRGLSVYSLYPCHLGRLTSCQQVWRVSSTPTKPPFWVSNFNLPITLSYLLTLTYFQHPDHILDCSRSIIAVEIGVQNNAFIEEGLYETLVRHPCVSASFGGVRDVMGNAWIVVARNPLLDEETPIYIVFSGTRGRIHFESDLLWAN